MEALKAQVQAALSGCLPRAQEYLATLRPFLDFLNVDVDLYMQHLAFKVRACQRGRGWGGGGGFAFASRKASGCLHAWQSVCAVAAIG